MSKKLMIEDIKKLIRETKLEEQYKEKFINNFNDVRQATLTEEQLDAFAKMLYEEIYK